MVFIATHTVKHFAALHFYCHLGDNSFRIVFKKVEPSDNRMDLFESWGRLACRVRPEWYGKT